MKRIGVAVLVALALGPVGVSRSIAQAPAPACLHGEDEAPDQAARRTQALGFVRHINELQASAFPANNAYQPADRLQLTRPLPNGFRFRLTTNGKAYAYSVQDSMDPCLFGYFGDEAGVIFRGEAIRPGRN